MTAALEVVGLTVRYGGLSALEQVDLSISAGEMVGLVGSNGAGKSTLLDCLSGHLRPDHGQVRYRGADVSALGPDQRARAGIIRSFQDGRLFSTLTARDVLLLAQERSTPTHLLTAVLGLPPWCAAERRRSAAAVDAAESMGLSPYLDRLVGELSTGVRRVLDLACVVALRPTVLLLDEPSSGLASSEVAAVPDLLRRVQEDTGATVVIVEHDLPLVFGVAGRIVVMEEGRVVADGAPPDVRRHPALA
jgi:ABC-type branched-subunit amino acid transport system ATPase component